jgi:hypothetical protein
VALADGSGAADSLDRYFRDHGFQLRRHQEEAEMRT